jgi:hypothetical protein
MFLFEAFAWIALLSWPALLLYSGLLCWLIWEVNNDITRHRTKSKWGVLLLIFVVAAIHYISHTPWSDVNFSSLLSVDLWTPVVEYLAIGLVYGATIATWLALRAERTRLASAWDRWLDGRFDVRVYPGFYNFNAFDASGMIRDVYQSGSTPPALLHEMLIRFTASWGSDLIRLGVREGVRQPSVSINVKGLSQSVAVWMLMWPAYALVSVLGDSLQWVIDLVTEVAAQVAQWVVNITYKDVFVSDRQPK